MDASRADQRRRRVLLEETCRGQTTTDTAVSAPASDSPLSTIPQRRYGHLATRQYQPPLTALLPTKRFTILLIALLALTNVAAVAAAYSQAWLCEDFLVADVQRLVDVRRPDSIPSCLLAACWLLIAVTSVLILQIRRHRRDDYRGTYRLWLWVAATSVLVAVDHVTHLHHLWQVVWQQWIGWPRSHPQLAWQAPAAMVGSYFILRMLMDGRECPGNWIWYLGCICGVVAAYAFHLPTTVDPASAMLASLLQYTSAALAAIALWVALLRFGRHIALDAEGLLRAIPQRSPTDIGHTKSKSPATAPNANAPRPTDVPSQQEPQRWVGATIHRLSSTTEPRSLQDVPSSVPSSTTDAVSPGDGLSRSQRKRLEKLQRKQKAGA